MMISLRGGRSLRRSNLPINMEIASSHCLLHTMTSKLILVTGATGYIASRLIPRLLERGWRVRALARHPERLKARKWFSQVEMAQGDVMIPETLIPALNGIHTAYYLIHNMASRARVHIA